MDEKDNKILELLDENAKFTSSQIAKKTNIPITTVHNRIRKMEATGVIIGYSPRKDYAKLGRGIGAYIFIIAGKVDQQQLSKYLLHVPGVEKATIITGGYDIVLEVRVGSMAELNDVITHPIRNMDGVERTQTMMMLEEM